MQPTELHADGLLLRPFQRGDAEAVHRACQDPAIQRWTRVPSPYLHEHAEDFVTARSHTDWAEGTGAPFAVCDAATGQLLGSCGLVSIDRVLRSAEVGYWTAPWARGQGVAVRATRAVARWAFDVLGMRRIVWQAQVGNHASRLVALRAGFTLAGRLRMADPGPEGEPDGWVGSLLPADLDSPAGQAAAPGSIEARRAAVFGRQQPVLPTATADGEQITLRRPQERDIDAIVAACQDPQTRRWPTVPDPYQRCDAEFFVSLHARRTWARGDGAVFAITDSTDAYVGSMELSLSPSDPLTGDIGFMAAPQFRGRGYVPAALAAVCAWGFDALGLARVEWRAFAGNTSSRRAAEKAGFVFEGIARSALTHRGQRVDAWTAALLATDPAVASRAGVNPQAASEMTP